MGKKVVVGIKKEVWRRRDEPKGNGEVWSERRGRSGRVV